MLESGSDSSLARRLADAPSVLFVRALCISLCTCGNVAENGSRSIAPPKLARLAAITFI
jgi:hypothetical protein